MSASLQVVHAQVLTLDHALPQAQAVLVGAGRVLAVGSRAEIQAQAPHAEVLDHRDLLLTPGLCDAHTHLVMYGFSLTQLDLQGSRSVAEVRAKLAERVARTPAGQWVVGGGFLMSELGLASYPGAEILDEVSPNHPVMLYSRDRHMAWVNSAALQLAGISENTPDPEGGKIVRPLGCLLELATDLVSRTLTPPSEAEFLAAAKAGADDLAARGFVSTHTMASEPVAAPRALQTLAARGELALRIWACLPHERLTHARDLGLALSPGGLFQWGGVKFFADGALGSRTAWLHEPGFVGGGTGIALDSPELIYERGLQALELGLTPVTHAIGDRANTEVLSAYEKLRPFADARGISLRIEHTQHLRPADIARFRGMTASVQPIHLLGDAENIQALVPHLLEMSYPLRSLLDAGAILAFGSDAPVAPPDIQANFAVATTRAAHGGRVVAAQQALSELEVLWAYTRGPALAAGWQDEGWIKPGARAAFTLWDKLGAQAQALVL